MSALSQGQRRQLSDTSTHDRAPNSAGGAKINSAETPDLPETNDVQDIREAEHNLHANHIIYAAKRANFFLTISLIASAVQQ